MKVFFQQLTLTKIYNILTITIVPALSPGSSVKTMAEKLGLAPTCWLKLGNAFPGR